MDTDKLKIDVIKAIKAFEKYLLDYKNSKEDVEAYIRTIPTYICDIIDKFKEYCDKSTVTKRQKFVVVTYLMRYYHLYAFLKNSYCNNKQMDAVWEIIQCVIKEYISLCNDTEAVFGEDHESAVGSFIKLMDMALEKIEEIDVNNGVSEAESNLESSLIIIEEILCFSMSIAQVGSNKDRTIISSSCQVVLNNLENLKVEIQKQEINLAMCKLLGEVCTNSLCALEAKVNIIVLNLCLKAFSDYRSHIEKLYDACLEITNKSALDFVISNFDMYMDRIFQIGLFCLSCSRINKQSAEIKVILSNLQFLEKELVPAFMAVATNTTKWRKNYAQFFKNYWCLQVKNLRVGVHNIIEPEAYCKLVSEELNQSLERIWVHMSKGDVIQKDMVDPFIIYSYELGKMIKTCLDTFDNGIKESVSTHLQVVYNVVQELEVATNVFLDETLNLTVARNINEKIFKRCKILVKAIKKLWVCIKKDEEATTASFNNETEDCHTCPKDEQLKSIIAKSRKIIKDRSIHMNADVTVKLNATRTMNSMAQSKRRFKLREGFIDNDTFGNAFADMEQTFANINEDRSLTF